MDAEDLSRRSLLQLIVAALGAAALPVGWPEIARASQEAHAAFQPPGEARLSFLSAAEAADVEAVAAQIIPTDDTPGARDAGVVYFIDRALATFLSRLADDYRVQLAEFQMTFRGRHPGAASFGALPSAEQIDYLETVDRTPFFDTTRLLTLLGMISGPIVDSLSTTPLLLIHSVSRHGTPCSLQYSGRGFPAETALGSVIAIESTSCRCSRKNRNRAAGRTGTWRLPAGSPDTMSRVHRLHPPAARLDPPPRSS